MCLSVHRGRNMKRAVMPLAVLGFPSWAPVAAHGPVFGLATPTNSQGEWSFDEGLFGRGTVRAGRRFMSQSFGACQARTYHPIPGPIGRQFATPWLTTRRMMSNRVAISARTAPRPGVNEIPVGISLQSGKSDPQMHIPQRRRSLSANVVGAGSTTHLGTIRYRL